MCFCLYLATSADPPVIPCHGPVGNGKIWTRRLREYQKAIRDKFLLPCVTEVGSDRGCGCGFRHDEGAVHRHDYDPSDTQPNHADLVAFLAEHCGTESFVELYGCWDGDHAKEVRDRRELALSELADERFHFRMDGYCRIRMPG